MFTFKCNSLSNFVHVYQDAIFSARTGWQVQALNNNTGYKIEIQHLQIQNTNNMISSIRVEPESDLTFTIIMGYPIVRVLI